MQTESPCCPYFVGNTLAVQVHHDDGEQQSETLEVTIVKIFEPFTLSCVLLVQLDWPSFKLEGQYVLKLFDRRYATQLRRDEEACLWTPEVESNYRKFVQTDGFRDLSAWFTEEETKDEWRPEADDAWNQAQLEAYLQYNMRRCYSTETTVYYRLRELQGRHVPRFFGRLRLHNSSDTLSETSSEASSEASSEPTSDLVNEYLDCPGILLEYIQGFPLTDIEKWAPRAAWQTIVDEAIYIINQIGEVSIRNTDVKTRSFLIQAVPHSAQFRVCMMDFGHCVLRRPDQDDNDWRNGKAHQDEEGAVGRVMQSKLPAGGFKYTRSLVAERLAADFMRGN